MKKLLIALFVLGFANISLLNAQNSNREELQDEAKKIVTDLKLDKSKERLVYNVLMHVETRIDDLTIGAENYSKLLGYIDEERSEMMKVIMPTKKYNEYDKLYSQVEKDKIEKLKLINEEYIKNSKDKGLQELDELRVEAIMQKDKVLAEAYR